MQIKSKIAAFLLTFFITTSLGAQSADRFFFSGDGNIHLLNAKTGQKATIPYRQLDGTYPQDKLLLINQIFDLPKNSSETISLRLISLLDYLQDHLGGGIIKIVSGYRSPEYNDGLRKNGRLAAKTSLHLEGMAADIAIEGVKGRGLWEFARSLHCCGAGYYHGKGIHIDVGPSRFWDETSAKVDQNLGGHNKLILLRTNYDVYHPGETAHMVLGRITDYPIGIRPEGLLIKGDKEVGKIRISEKNKDCLLLKNREEARSLSGTIPKDFQGHDTMQIQINFCEKKFPEMPERALSNFILIKK